MSLPWLTACAGGLPVMHDVATKQIAARKDPVNNVFFMWGNQGRVVYRNGLIFLLG
ncbi:MAG: hypothetical protein WCI20_13315 [bacterium]